MRFWPALFAALSAVHAARLPLSDKALPYFGLDSGTLRWDSESVLDALQRARFAEISPRGIRFAYDDAASPPQHATESCTPAPRCLCRMLEGLILPSPGADMNATILVGAPERSDILRQFALASQSACAYNGVGRNMSAGSSNYTISGCDVLQGRLVVAYWPGTDQLTLLQQTLGPMAYAASILVKKNGMLFFFLVRIFISRKQQAALACLYFSATTTTDAAVVGMTLSVALLFVRVPFITRTDELHFLCSWIMACCMAPGAIWRGDQERSAEASVLALSALADAVYRTPETPYAPLICLFLTIRQWLKLIRLCHAERARHLFPDAVDLLLTTFYLCFTLDAGFVPQLTHPEDWPIYGGAGAYVAFAGAYYYHLQQAALKLTPAKNKNKYI